MSSQESFDIAHEEESIPFLAELMKDVEIKDDVKDLLGPEIHGSRTWGDVHNRMQDVSTGLKKPVLNKVKNKLRKEVKIMRDEEEVARAAQYDLVLILHQINAEPYVHRQSHKTKSNNSEATGFNDQTQAAREEVATAAQYDLVPRLHQATADPHVRRQTKKTMNNANDEGPDKFHLAVAKLLAGVDLNNAELVVSLIVGMVAQYNVRMTAKTTAKMKEGEETVQTEASQSSSDIKIDKGKGKATEGQDFKGKASTGAAATTVQVPLRDYRDAQGVDHGYAMRQQYLNPPEDPCTSV